MDELHDPLEEHPQSLEELYALSLQKYENIVIHQSQVGDSAVMDAIHVIESCRKRVTGESLFSKNEELEEYSTNSIKFLFLDYFLGKVHSQYLKLNSRKGHLLLSRELLIDYLEMCKRLGVLDDDDKVAVELLLGEDDDDVGSQGTLSRSRGAGGSAEQRARKIAKFKRDKESQTRMTALKAMLTAFADSEEDGIPASSSSQKSTFDYEEVSRELLILQMQHYARDSLDEVPLIAQELGLLAHMGALQDRDSQAGQSAPSTSTGINQHSRGIDSNTHSPEAAAERQLNRSQLPGAAPLPPGPDRPGLSITRTALIEGQVVMTRETVKASVFTPSMAPPTMTLEEFADLEIAQAEARAAAQKDPQQQMRSDPSRRYDQLLCDGDEDDEDAVEQAAYNDRAWDDWKESNPKGSGNKAGKRF